jgi:hypothetical protein
MGEAFLTTTTLWYSRWSPTSFFVVPKILAELQAAEHRAAKFAVPQTPPTPRRLSPLEQLMFLDRRRLSRKHFFAGQLSPTRIP